MIDVSVVIPTKNEEFSIGVCIEKIINVFEKNKINGEIIVSDSSSDRTPEIAASLGAKVVSPDKLGYGYAYRYGFKHATGEYIVMGDADNTYDFSLIPDLIYPLKNGTADFVIGSRFKGKIMKGAMPVLHQYIGNPVLTGFLNQFFGAKVSDAHCGLRAFSKCALDRMRLASDGMEFASEMIIEAVRNSLRIAEVPITYYPRMGDSKLGSFKDGWRHLKFMLLYAPKYLYLIPGLIIFLLGLSVVIFASFGVLIGQASFGIHSMIFGSFSMVTGYQLFVFGLIAGYYGKKKNLFKIDIVTKAILEHASIDKGIALGLLLFGVGLFYLTILIMSWIESGFKALPLQGQDIIGFSVLVIGLQTLFSSFLLGMVDGDNSR